jgi:hypothetical protein
MCKVDLEHCLERNCSEKLNLYVYKLGRLVIFVKEKPSENHKCLKVK